MTENEIFLALEDRMVLYLLSSNLMVKDIIQVFFPTWSETNQMVLCPFHNDTKPSLHINEEGKSLCFSCSFSSTNIIDFYSKMCGVTYKKAREELYNIVVEDIKIEDYVVRRYTEILFERREVLEAVKRRGIKEQTIIDFMLGFDPSTNMLVIPYFDLFGSCIGLKLYDILRINKSKFIYKVGGVRLYPEWKILDLSSDRILLVEGEIDCITGWILGIPTFTWGSALSWKDNWSWLLKDKKVFVLFDEDTAGKEGIKRVSNKLEKLGSNYVVLNTLLAPFSGGKDLNDWYLSSNGEIHRIKEAFFTFTFTERPRNLLKYCPYCGRYYDKSIL